LQIDIISQAPEKLHATLNPKSAISVLLQYTDNPEWVSEIVQNKIKTEFPLSDIMIRPLSLTSGVHTGPGTWAVAFLPVSGEMLPDDPKTMD